VYSISVRQLFVLCTVRIHMWSMCISFFMLLERLRYRVYISCNVTNIIAVGYEEIINLDHKIIKATLCGIECRWLCSDCKQPHTTHYIVNLSITLTQHIHPPSYSHLSLLKCQLVLFLHWSCFTAIIAHTTSVYFPSRKKWVVLLGIAQVV